MKMQKMTSACANKLLRSLEEDKAYWVNKEDTSCTYIAASNEIPVISEYDYAEEVFFVQDLTALIIMS